MGERDWIPAGARISYGGCPPKQDGQHSLAGRAEAYTMSERDPTSLPQHSRCERCGRKECRQHIIEEQAGSLKNRSDAVSLVR